MNLSPNLLPPIPDVRRRAQSLAMLDAVLSPEWEYRYYSFNSDWGPGEAMASMRNGSGDDWYLLFDSAGAALRGFAHELAHDPSLPGNIQKQVPKDFSSFLAEPAFSMQHATFCYWRKSNDASLSQVVSRLGDDGSEDMLALLVSGPAEYKAWAEDYYEVPVALDVVESIFSHLPLDDAIILTLNPDADLDYIYGQAKEIGYPATQLED